MRRTAKIDNGKQRSPRSFSSRPTVELLEDRLPPGDVLLGLGLAGSWLGLSIAGLGADSRNAIPSPVEIRLGQEPVSPLRIPVAVPSQRLGSALPFTTYLYPWREERYHTPADPVRIDNPGAVQNRGGYRDLAGMRQDVLDWLIADEFDLDLSLPSSCHCTAQKANADCSAPEDNASRTEAGRGGATGAPSSSGSEGFEGSGTGSVERSNGSAPATLSGLSGYPLANGLAGSFHQPLTAAPTTPNGTPAAPSAKGGAEKPALDAAVTGSPAVVDPGPPDSHGTIRPFALVGSWPSDTPPISINSVYGSSGAGGSNAVANRSPSGATEENGGGMNDSIVTSASSIVTSDSGGCDCSGGCDSGGASSVSAGSDGMIENASGVYDYSISYQSAYSPAGVRYFDGELNRRSVDVQSSGFGSVWSQTRTWSNGSPPTSFNGAGVIDTDRPYLLRPNGDDTKIVAISSNVNARYYDLVGSVYVPHFFVQDQLTHPSGEFVLTDTRGDQVHFYDFTAPQANQRGQFKSCTDPKGNLVSVVSLTPDGKVAEMQRTDSSLGITESYLYTYLAAPDLNAGQLSNLTLRRQTGGGPWTVVRQAAYDYYDGTAQKPYGNLGDLRTATVLDGNNNVIDTKYYRYYTSADAGTIGYVHGLKYSFSPQSYARLAAGVASPLTATDSQVAPYANDYFEYDPTSQRVTKAVVQGKGCSACTGGQGTFTYSYATSSNPNGYNSWLYKTIETLPDSSTNTVYANYAGEVMLRVFQNSGQKWETFYKYDGAGRILLKANPSAVTGYNDAYADLLDQTQVGDYGYLSSNTGLIELTDYFTSTTATETTAGGVAGYYQDTKLEQGKSGTPILQKSVQYFAHSGGSTVYPTATSTVYRNTDGSGAETTSYAYTWYTGTTQVQSQTVTLPVISAAQNGPGVADTVTTNYDANGRVTQTTDADGFVNTMQYDQFTGAVTQKVVDSGTGHLNLTTTMVVDALGRTTKLTDPNGNVTYTVYNDANHEVRIYPGWTGTTTTGPTQVRREDRAHDPSYTETFTISATPHATGGQPDGTEAYSFLQSLSRTITSRGGQVTESDAYFYLGGIAYSSAIYLGTAGTNFYATQYAYDMPRGWRTRVQLPTGTINRTVYDALGRVVSTWVGTNDTPASGSWSPTNNTPPSNMVQVTGNVYDGGGIGDSTLTQVTQYPGGTAASRVAQNSYDWRDRLIASKQGVQANESDGTHRPILYRQLDNLGEITSSERYDGDGVTITSTGGVPNRPDPTLLRAQTTPQYDDQGRVFQSNTFSVDQSNGTVSANSLTTNTWYNHRGQVIKTAPPGAPVTKTTYDGARRPTFVYTTDAYLDSTWSDATTVSSNNNVLTQRQIAYDNDGNPILVTSSDRFDNETQGGPLGNPTTHPYARVSYVANYYDAANRLTDSVNIGTNGGTAYTRPSTPPARSDTALITSTGYKADAVQQVTLTGSPTGGTFTLSFGGQTTAAIAYNAAASAVQSALQALSTIGAGNALASGPAGGPWLVRFAGSLAETPQAELTGNASGLTGGTSPSVSIGTTSQGGDSGRGQKTTDPRALMTKTDYDLIGRTVRTVENFVAFAPSNSADRTTQYTYDGSNHILTLTAVLPGSVLETTQYAYGVTGSVINSNDLLASVTYPANGQTNTESYTYDALGEAITKSDRNGSTHSYSFDVLGRQTSDSVTTLGANVSGAVQRIDTAYDTGGRSYLFTSYANTGGTTIVNQVQRLYNGLGQLITEYQSHAGAVNTTSTPKVQYAYSFVASSGGPNHSRIVSMTYPSSRVLNYNYNSGVDDRISRLSSLSDSLNTYESYSYLGLGTVVQRSHPISGLTQSYTITGGNPDGGDQYTGLDRFGRIVEQRWSLSSTTTDDFLYSYDRDGNRLTRTNGLNAGFNEQYGYDSLNQLTSFTRGSHTQSWSLDGVGNWATFTNDGNTQTRTHNVQNQITSISGATTPTYDNNGDTTTDQTGQTYTYDAWNRPTGVVSGANTLTYAYDGLNHRTSRTLNSVQSLDLYYSSSWQVLEEDQTGSPQLQYVWSPLYVDALVERDSGATRLFVQQDANWNVTAIVVSGSVQERCVYDPYGKPSFYNASWSPWVDSFNWVYLHQGGRYDSTSGLYHFRNRDYSPTLGRWMQQDPLGYVPRDMSLYVYVKSNPSIQVDATGLIPGPLAVIWSWALGCFANPLCRCIVGAIGLGITEIIGQLLGPGPISWGNVACSTLTGCFAGVCLGAGPLTPPCLALVLIYCKGCSLACPRPGIIC